MTTHNIGHLLAKFRRHAGLSQTALARKVRLSQAAISEIENGNRNPSFSTLAKLAKALDFQIELLHDNYVYVVAEP